MIPLSKRKNEAVTPCVPVAAYIGGKKQLAKKLVAMIEAVPHTTYAEPFVGMGGVFLRRQSKPRVEVINDASGDVANFFRILQRHLPALLDALAWQVTSRTEFERLTTLPPDSLTDVERAARFLYLQRLAFGGKVVNRVFGVAPERPARFNAAALRPRLEAIHARLSGVVIESLGYADFIERYDRRGTLFYLDPPYYGSERYYGAGMFGRADFTALADQLGQIKGRFILTLNDRPEVREIFKRFPMQSADLTYTVGKDAAKAVSELIIRSK